MHLMQLSLANYKLPIKFKAEFEARHCFIQFALFDCCLFVAQNFTILKNFFFSMANFSIEKQKLKRKFVFKVIGDLFQSLIPQFRVNEWKRKRR